MEERQAVRYFKNVCLVFD